METLAGAVLGLIVGGAATRTHPRVDPGLPLGILAGLLGGLLGQYWWGASLSSILVEQTLAGAVAAGALGGLLIAPVVGVGVNILRDYLKQSRVPSEPVSPDD